MKKYVKAATSEYSVFEDVIWDAVDAIKEDIDWSVSEEEIIDDVISDVVYSDRYWGALPKSIAYKIQEDPKWAETFILNLLKDSI